MMSDVFSGFFLPPNPPKSDFVRFQLMPLFYEVRFDSQTPPPPNIFMYKCIL